MAERYIIDIPDLRHLVPYIGMKYTMLEPQEKIDVDYLIQRGILRLKNDAIDWTDLSRSSRV
jgi:hypothetical protein